MESAERNLTRSEEEFLIEKQISVLEPQTVRDSAARTEPDDFRGSLLTVADTRAIVGIQNSKIVLGLVLKQSALSGCVGFERVMTVEMVRRDVGDHTDV